MELIFEKTPTAKVQVGDKKWELSLPTMRQVKELEDLRSKSDGKEGEAIDMVIKLLDKLGLPEKDAWDLEVGIVLQIFETISNYKKKT